MGQSVLGGTALQFL